MRTILAAAAAAMAMAAASHVSAAVYLNSLDVGSAHVDLSVTTDDTLGILSKANITAFDITITDGMQSVNLTQGNSVLTVIGDSLFSSGTGLFFDFRGSLTELLSFQLAPGGGGQPLFCVQVNACYNMSGPGIGALAGGDFFANTRSISLGGIGRIATSSTDLGPFTPMSGAPEPATWATLLAGFFGIGALMRQRRFALA